MSHSSPTSPFVYDSATRSVRSVDPDVRILCDDYMGGGDSYRTYTVAISRGPYTYCFHAGHDYLKEKSGEYLLTADGRPLGYEVKELRTRWQTRDQSSGESFASTFPDDEDAYREAAQLAIDFYSTARLRRDAPLRRIRFDRSEKLDPKVVEVGDAL